ncbi:MAG: hypothetical protein J5927_06670 [Oscillospiraceae bacterium]|nr:hypothetical protein [Oscillospiraceae bacterium]
MRKWFRSPVMSTVLFLLAGLMLLGGSIGGTRAALTYYSENYQSQVSMNSIGVSLLENGRVVSYRNYGSLADGNWSTGTGYLVRNLVKDAGDSSFKYGKTYREELAVSNSGAIPQYVRVTIYKYWVESRNQPDAYGWVRGEGTKKQNVDPSLIDLHLVNTSQWRVDAGSSTTERTVLYYQGILAPGQTSVPFCDTLTVKPAVVNAVKQTTTTNQNGKTVITTTYAYDDMCFVLMAVVDTVQTHNAERALPSAWGRGLAG